MKDDDLNPFDIPEGIIEPGKDVGHRGSAPELAGEAGFEEDGGPKIAIQLGDFVAYSPTNKFIFVPTGDEWEGASINARIPPVFAGRDKKGEAIEISPTKWLHQNASVEQKVWAPGEPPMIEGRLLSDEAWLERAGARVINLYRAPTVAPRKADVRPWLRHIREVYPEHWKHVVRYLAYKVQFPAVKINHGLVLGGYQGIGKDTLLEPAKVAVGPWNWQETTPREVLDKHNGYLQSVMLRVSEARDLGESDRFKFYDHMKTAMTAPPNVHRINDKYLRAYPVRNVCGVVITTNYRTGGLYLPPDDRRHYVMWSPLPERHFPPEYFAKLYAWYAAGGNEIVADYLLRLDISSFDPKAPPPKTEAFWAMVDANRSPETGLLADRLEEMGRPAVVTLDQVRAGATEELLKVLEGPPRLIPHRFDECRYEAIRNPASERGNWKFGGKSVVVYGDQRVPLSERLRAIEEWRRLGQSSA